MHQGVVSQQIGLLVQGRHSLVQRGFVGHCQLLSRLHLLLDLVLQLGHIEHQLVHFAAPHGQLLSLQLVLEVSLPLLDLLSAVFVADGSELSKAALHFHSVNVIPRVSSNSLLLLSALEPSLPTLQVGFVVSQSGFHLEEPLDRALVLSFLPLELGYLLLFLFNRLKESIDVGLFLVKVNLVVVLVLGNVSLLQVLVLFEHSLVELVKQLVVGGLKLLDVSVVVGELHFFSHNGEVRASIN